MRIRLISGLGLASLQLISVSTAQVAPSAPPAGTPVPYASVSELNLLLSQLEQTSQATQLDMAKLRIEKWKTDANTKRGTQADVESIQRNLQNALPEIVTQLRNSPENLGATFKLYRNLTALYDVFSSVVESAGAFGSKDEFQSLQNDLAAMERSRHSCADRMEALSDSKEGELTRLRTQVQTLQGAQATAPPKSPKKIVVDDSQPPEKPVKRKSTAKSTKPASTGTSQKPASTTESQQRTQPPNPPQSQQQ
jgi:hypothetical protein